MSKPDLKLLEPVIGLDLIPLNRHDLVVDGKKRGKSPKDKNWRERDYSVDQVQKHMAAGGNVGIRLAAHHLVVDIDPRAFKGEDVEARFFADFALKLDDFPWTATPSGGKHVFMSKREDLQIATALESYPGIEIKTLGTQVVAPGSLHPEKPGHYVANDTFLGEYGAPPPAPAALLEAVKRKKPECRDATAGAHTHEQLEILLSGLPVEAYDSNDAWFPILAASHHATDGEGVEEFVTWSISDLKYAESEHDIRTRWHSLDAARSGGITVHTIYKELNERGKGKLVDEAKPRSSAEEDFAAEPFSHDPALLVIEAPKPSERSRFVKYGLDDLAKVETPRWLVDRLIPENGLAVIYGPPKTGKTFWAMALSLCVASGEQFCGRQTLSGAVTYIAAEGGKARLRDRALAYLKNAKLDTTRAKDWSLIAERATISDQKEVAKVIEAIGPRQRLVVIDTLARSMAGDENSQQDMGAFIKGCDRIREETGATVLIVHHTGKDASAGARGSSALRGAIDTGLLIRRGAKDSVVVKVEDQRDDEALPPMHFQLVSVMLGGIEDETSAALVPTEAAYEDDAIEVLELAISLGNGATQSALAKELAASRGTTERNAVNYLQKFLAFSKKGAAVHDGKAIWLERLDPANKQSGVTVRVAELQDA